LDPLKVDSFIIESKILGEEQEIFVYLPKGYEELGAVYPRARANQIFP
jgi:hypothetical protein